MSALRTLTGSSWHTEDIDVDHHLSLLALQREQPTLDLLEELHRRHVHTFPFAAVDVLLGQHPGVEPGRVSQRLLTEAKGGYCFEHAQLFAATCESLGFEVHRHLGRVHAATSPRTHMSVEVVIDDTSYLTDPGFGLSITGPIEMTEGARRQEPHGEYTLHRHDHGGIQLWELRRNGGTAHISDTVPVMPIDVSSGHVVTSTHSTTGSLFTRTLIASRYIHNSHISLAGTTLTTRRAGQPTQREELTAQQAVDTVQQLGVVLSQTSAHRLRTMLSAGAAEIT